MNLLYWSEQGEIACGKHAPYPGTDTWRWRGWMKMTPSQRLEYARLRGEPAKCEIGTACGPRAEWSR